VLVVALATHARAQGAAAPKAPAEMTLPAMPGYHIRFGYADCDDVQRCWVQLELVSPTGASIAKARSENTLVLGNDAVLTKERAHLGPSFEGPSWNLGDRNRDLTLGTVVFALDPRTAGLALFDQGEGADYTHRGYEIWAFALEPRPAIYLVRPHGRGERRSPLDPVSAPASLGVGLRGHLGGELSEL
jgi:hypothetical protein